MDQYLPRAAHIRRRSERSGRKRREDNIPMTDFDPRSASAAPVPMNRILDRLDLYMGRRDYDGAERHLLYWLEEAKQGNDLQGQLQLCNELVGFYRKTDRCEDAHKYSDAALELLEKTESGDRVITGTTCVNIATAYCAFDEEEKALPLFEKARAVYESNPLTPPHLKGGLYNNMALALQKLGRFDEALSSYGRALELMRTVPGSQLEQAITCLNMADTVASAVGLEQGEARIYELLDQAYDLLQDKSLEHNGYYAFVCEKCAPGFSYYGYFVAAQELEEEAKRIYERA